MRIYRTVGSLDKFYNVKLGQLEHINFSNMERIRSDNPSYKGWVIQFFREVPDDFLLELSRNRFIFLILKDKNSDQYYAIVSVFPYENEKVPKMNKFGKYDYNYIRNKLINRYLKRKSIVEDTAYKGYHYAKRYRKKSHT